jgi:hypothetical protein
MQRSPAFVAFSWPTLMLCNSILNESHHPAMFNIRPQPLTHYSLKENEEETSKPPKLSFSLYE